MKIAFFLSDYPVFSETFITNELLWLQKSKIKGNIWYEVPRKGKKQPAIAKIKYPLQKIPSKIISKSSLKTIVAAHFYWLLKNPLIYIRTLLIAPLTMGWWRPKSLIKAPLVARQIESFQPELVYVHDADNASYHAIVCAKLCQIPLGIIFHTYHLFYQNKHLKHKMEKADFSIFQSEYSKKYAIKKTQLDTSNQPKLHVISSAGIDTDFFHKKTPTPNKLNSKNTIDLITVCRLEETKGLDLLIKSIQILKKRGYAISCKIIGDGSQKKQLEKLRDSLSLTSEVSFLGKIPHSPSLIKYLSSAGIFILPSVIGKTGDRDMQPNVIKEAMSMGLLVVASNLGGIKEVIKDNQNGFIIQKVTPTTIASKIEIVHQLSDKEKGGVSGQARKTILNKYQAEKINQQLISLFSHYGK